MGVLKHLVPGAALARVLQHPGIVARPAHVDLLPAKAARRSRNLNRARSLRNAARLLRERGAFGSGAVLHLVDVDALGTDIVVGVLASGDSRLDALELALFAATKALSESGQPPTSRLEPSMTLKAFVAAGGDGHVRGSSCPLVARGNHNGQASRLLMLPSLHRQRRSVDAGAASGGTRSQAAASAAA